MTQPKIEFSGGRLALDLCNTLSRGRASGPRDRLSDPAGLASWAARAGWAFEGVPEATELAEMRGMRAALLGIFDRLVEGEAPDPRHLSTLNAGIASAGASSALVPDANGNWILADRAERPLELLRHAIAKDAAALLTGDVARVKRCLAHDCLWLFLDSSKNLSRRWCVMNECGARSKMRRLRSRHRY